MLKKILPVTMVLLIGMTPLFADYGRDLVSTGSPVMISGSLEYDAPYWYLASGGKTYQLHFGNLNFLSTTGIPLKEGNLYDVEGIVEDNDIVVFAATSEGKTYRFRNEYGVPLWAGGRYREDGRNRPAGSALRREEQPGRGCCCDSDSRPYGQGLLQNRS